MSGLVARWARWGILLGVLGVMSGCMTQAPPSDFGSEQNADGSEAEVGRDEPTPEQGDEGPPGDDDSPIGGGGLFTDCGSRTVTSIPGPGYLEVSASLELDVVPADAPLAKALFGATLCQNQYFDEVPVGLYEVGEDGKVLAIITLFESGGSKLYMRNEMPGNQWFTLEDGCFSLGYGAEQFEFDRTFVVAGPCGLGQPALSHEGQVFVEPIGEYICLSGVVSYCRDCWGGNGAWYSDTVVSGGYTALGSIKDVPVAGWTAACNGSEQFVDISAGDSIDIRHAMRMTYRTSPSPKELGYTELAAPTLP